MAYISFIYRLYIVHISFILVYRLYIVYIYIVHISFIYRLYIVYISFIYCLYIVCSIVLCEFKTLNDLLELACPSADRDYGIHTDTHTHTYALQERDRQTC